RLDGFFFGERLFNGLDEVGPLVPGREIGGAGFGRLPLGVGKSPLLLETAAEDAPQEAFADDDFRFRALRFDRLFFLGLFGLFLLGAAGVAARFFQLFRGFGLLAQLVSVAGSLAHGRCLAPASADRVFGSMEGMITSDAKNGYCGASLA